MTDGAGPREACRTLSGLIQWQNFRASASISSVAGSLKVGTLLLLPTHSSRGLLPSVPSLAVGCRTNIHAPSSPSCHVAGLTPDPQCPGHGTSVQVSCHLCWGPHVLLLSPSLPPGPLYSVGYVSSLYPGGVLLRHRWPGLTQGPPRSHSRPVFAGLPTAVSPLPWQGLGQDEDGAADEEAGRGGGGYSGPKAPLCWWGPRW